MSATVLQSSTIDDRDANVTYAPPQWTVHTNVESIFHLYGNTDTFSDIQGATATVKFYGNTIEYWGNTGPYHGPCIISVDGKQMATVNSHADADGYPVLLYSKTDLIVGDHVLEVKVVNPSYPNVCEVDRFVANVTSGTPSSGTGTAYGAPSTTSGTSGGSNVGGSGGKKGPPIAAIAGAAGGAAVLILLLGLLLYIRSRKKNSQKIRIMAISKPLLAEDGVPSSPPPQTPNFPHDYSHNHNPNYNHYHHPISYATSSFPGPVSSSSYNPPSTYTHGSPPLGTVDAFNPYAYNANANANTHSSPGPAPSSTLSDTHTHSPTNTTVFSSSHYSTSPSTNPGPVSVSAFTSSPIPELSQYEYARRSEKSTYPGSISDSSAFATATSTDARASGSTGPSVPVPNPGVAVGAAGRPRRDILSAEVSDLPPPAYED